MIAKCLAFREVQEEYRCGREEGDVVEQIKFVKRKIK